MEFVLLGMITETPMHGYDIYKLLCQPGGLSEIWHINQSNLYALLDGLEENGYLISHLLQIGNSPFRKEYHSTSTGMAVFEKWVREPVLHGRDMRQVFLAKLFFALKENPDTLKTLLKNQKAVADQWLMDLETSCNKLPVLTNFDRLVLDSRKKQITAWMEWLDDCAQ